MKHAVIPAVFAVILSALVCTAVFAAESDANSSAAQMSISGDDNLSTKDSGKYTVLFNEQTPFDSGSFDLTYTATLYKDGKAVSGAVSPSSGSMDNNVEKTLTVSKQGAGTYELRVVFTEKVKFTDDEETQTIEHTASKTIRFINPIVLTIELTNKGSVSLTDAHVVFYLDGKILEDSATDVSIDVGSSKKVTYDYLPVSLSKGAHTYYLLATDGSDIDGIGPDHASTFYYQQGSYDFLNWVGAIMVIVFAVLLAWVLTKPVKNFGKPKARKAKKA